MMNRRENILAILRHEPHDHVGVSGLDVKGTGGNLETFENGPAGGGYDGWGIKWARTASTMGAGLPAPGSPVLSDITRWKETVVFPDLDAFDWKEAAAAQLAAFDPENQVQEYGMWNGMFLRMMHLMGFEAGLMALAEEPEASYELLGAITDYKIRLAERAVEFFRPDVICTYDDVATERGLFMSPAAYTSLIMPHHTRFNAAVARMGVIPNLHVCGKCDTIVPLFADEGAAAWEVCQPENDLDGLRLSQKGRLAFVGGYDGRKYFSGVPDEETLRKSVRDTIDFLAPDSNYIFSGMIMYEDPQATASAGAIIRDEATKYSQGYYTR